MKKKTLLIGTAALLALASCSNDETLETSLVNSDQIRYSVITSNATRADTIYTAGDSYSNVPNFYVWASYYKSLTESDGSSYFEKDLVKGSTGIDLTADRYWPREGYLDFYARTNVNAFNSTLGETFTAARTVGADNAVTNPTLKITGISMENNADDQKDLLYAVSQGFNKKANAEGSSNAPDAYNGETGVYMNFRHALAQLVFQFKCVNPSLSVKVDEVRLVNIKTTGDLTIQNSTLGKKKYDLASQSYITNGEEGQYVEDNTTYNWDIANQAEWGANLGDLNDPEEVELEFDSGSKIKVMRNKNVTIGDVTRKNWAFAKLATETPITLSTTPKRFYDEAVAAAEINRADYTEESDYNAAVAAATATAAATNKLNKSKNAVLVIPQEITAGKINKYNGLKTTSSKENDHDVYDPTIGDNLVKTDPPSETTTLANVSGMYFLIKCSIQNKANTSAATASDDDLYLHGDKPENGKSGTKFVLVPVRQTTYSTDDQSEHPTGDTDTTYSLLTKWEQGKKYIYTFIFGDKGSNAGYPVDPDPDDTDDDGDDPDDPNPIDPEPTLSVITYNTKVLTIDDWATGNGRDVNVSVNDSEEETTSDPTPQN